MIPILDCNNLTYLFKLIRPPKTEDELYKGNLKRKKKREEEASKKQAYEEAMKSFRGSN